MTNKIIRFAGWLSCLGKAIEIDNFTLIWDNLNSCKENEMGVGTLNLFRIYQKSYNRDYSNYEVILLQSTAFLNFHSFF